jgi:signal transduction histidine kinase/AraC-like DNA-binding protein
MVQMKRTLSMITALLCALFSCDAQENADSLQLLLKKARGHERVEILNGITSRFITISLDSASYYNDQSFRESTRLDYKAGIARANLNKALICEAQGKYDTARHACQLALTLFKKIKDRKGIADACHTFGDVYGEISEYIKATEYLRESLHIYEQIGNKEGQCKVYGSLGRISFMQSRIDEALQFYLEGSKISEETGNEKIISGFYTNLGVMYQSKKNYENALIYYYKSLDLKEKLNDAYGQATLFNNLSLIYTEQKEYDKALQVQREGLKLDKAIGSEKDIATGYNNIGNIYLGSELIDSALVYFNMSLEIRDRLGLKRDIAHSLDNVGYVYAKKGDYPKAIEYYKGSLSLNESIGDKKRMAYNYRKLGNAYMQLGEYTTAEHHLGKSLAIINELGDYFDSENVLLNLASLYESSREHRKALEFYKQYMEVRDSVSGTTRQKQILELQTRYETEKKEQELAVQKQQVLLLQQKQKIESFWKKLLLTGIIGLSLAGILLFRFQRKRSKRDRHLLEVQKSLTEQLQSIDRMKSRFFANISHEFRTPLTLILSPVGSLIDEVKEPALSEKLKVIQRNARSLLKLINQMLDLSRIEAGKLELKASSRNIVPFLRGLFFSFHSLAKQKKMIMEFNCAEDAIMVFFDTEKLEQVINNLLSNAFKFTPASGKISLTVSRTVREDDEFVEIRLEDTGPGIPKDQLPYIFDRFFQADNSDTREYEGSGIGLSLASELTGLHKGKIMAGSEPGRGTTMRVFLPLGSKHLKPEEMVTIFTKQELSSSVGQEDSEVRSSMPSETITAEDADRPTILIVEDHSDLGNFLKKSLTGKYHVKYAGDGKEGLEMALKSIPDLIISDVMMPKMNGIRLCNKIKSDIRTSHVPVILLTARSAIEDRLEGLKNQADDYISKPFDSRELLLRIGNLIEIRNKLKNKFKDNVIVKPEDIEVSSMDKVFISKIMKLLEANIGDEHFGVEQLSTELGISRVHLHRKLQALTNHSPSHFIRNFRLQRAMDLLQKNAGTVSEVAYTVGFSSSTYFSKCFSDEFGYPPKEVKQHLAR